MNEDDGERFYFDEYMTVLSPILKEASRVLDVGAQFGRFTIPLVAAGHHVVATDIDKKCLAYIRRRAPAAETLREPLVETAGRQWRDRFDIVLCLEVLYLIPEWELMLSGLAGALLPGGKLLASHRSQGYVMHRLLRDRDFDGLDLVLAGRHPAINAQPLDDLVAAYEDVGLHVDRVTAIGGLSGIAVDPFAALVDPSRMSRVERLRLHQYETDPTLNRRFAESARYLLVVASG